MGLSSSGATAWAGVLQLQPHKQRRPKNVHPVQHTQRPSAISHLWERSVMQTRSQSIAWIVFWMPLCCQLPAVAVSGD